LSESDAALYEAPFAHVVAHVKPDRMTKAEPALKDYWWRFGRPRVELRLALRALPRFIATVAHSKHRFFTWLPVTTSPDQALITVARADDTTLGLLHNRLHELWSLRLGTSIGVGNDPRYTPTTCFETFPFPAGLTPADTARQHTESLPDGVLIPADLPATVREHASAIARAAKRLTDLRDAWLNPPEWTERVPEVVPLGTHRRQTRPRKRTRQAHADEPLQPAPGLARASARGARRRRGRGLRLGRLHVRDARG
jgi:hypothetical protein